MKKIAIDGFGFVTHGDETKVICPVRHLHEEESFQCDADCAWFNIKPVTEAGIDGAFCGDKFIGNMF